jgi:iron complex transport system ATP-binding protein
MFLSARIAVQGVTLSYAASPALDDVTLEVPAGDFLGILGPNGSGKTTLLRTVARALTPDRGCVLLDGEDVRRSSPSKLARKMAVAPQITVPTLDFTAGELVRMGRSPYQGRWGTESRKDREVAAEAMRLTDTLAFADRVAGTLSGGEYQRVLIARALAQEPQVLLLDEPTAHLDLSAQISLLELLHRLNRERGITLIAVLHDLNLAAAYCRRLALMKKGRLVALGSPEETLTAIRVLEVYGTEALVRPHPLTGRPMVMPVPGAEAAFPEGPRPRVHVVCGGGTGASLLRALAFRGFPVTAGALNVGDTDHSVAKELGLEISESPPFSPLTPESIRATEAMIARAEVTVLTDAPFGPGNLGNLAALRNAPSGHRLLIVEVPEDREWDFTGGEAARLKEDLRRRGAETASGIAEVLAALLPGAAAQGRSR